jgi:hypothetical protein
MRSRQRWITTLLALALAIASAPLLADGSLLGAITGRVTDETGGALPGVTVELLSKDQGFRRAATTDAGGAFAFPGLATGAYTVRATLSGFQSFEAADNIVSAEKTTSVNVSLRLASEQASITVTGEVPLVDKTNTAAQTRIESTLTQKLAVGRSYQSLVAFTPGLADVDNDGNLNSLGATEGSNLYLFDGVDTTDPTTGTFGANSNFEAIEEVVVSNAGISAEYGRAQGAIVNVITKSGTNEFEGSAKAIVTNDDWNEQNKGTNPISGVPFARVKFDENIYRYSFTLGGPIVRDYAWFFGAYETADQTTPQRQTQTAPGKPDTGESYQQTTNTELWSAKLTGQISPSHSLTFQAQADPISGFVVEYWPAAEREALTSQSQADDCDWACVWQARWSGVFGTNVSAEAGYAQQRGGITVAPFEGNGTPYFSFTDGLYYNGATFDGFVQRPRDQANAAVSIYQQLFGNSHNIKIGVDYQDFESVSSFIYPTNELFLVTDFDPATRQPILEVGDVDLRFTDPAASVSKGTIWGFYALDRFEVSDRFSFNVGLRVDMQDGESDLGGTVFDATNFSPRLTATYDLAGNGKTLLSAGYGRYYQFLIQSIADSVYSGVPQQSNYDEFHWDGSDWVFFQSVRVGGNTQPVNNGLEPSYTDEFNLAFQQQIGNTMAVGVRGIYRKWGDLIDDARFIDENGVKITTPQNFSDDVLEREYQGLIFTFEKRFSDNWQALASYTLSKAEGNHESNFTSQMLDYTGDTCNVPTIGPMPCEEALNHNRYGYLSYDQRHQVRMYGAYTFPIGAVNLTAGSSFNFASGLPYQEQRSFAINGDTDTYFYSPRGSDNLPDTYFVDAALEATFRAFNMLEIGVKGEVFNVTNQQKIIDSTRIRLVPDANYGAPTSRLALQAPRSYRFTGLLRF